MYLNSINIYRGISILLIVSAHCYSISEIKIDTFPEALFANLTAGSTINFIFISGFLFHHVFYLREKTRRFLTQKLRRLLIPYTILSIVPIFLKLQLEPNFWGQYFPLGPDGFVNGYLIPTILYYITGAHLVAYWYIPFAVCLFIMYPIHIKFIELKPIYQLSILFLLFVIALLIHRPVDELNVLQSVVYFTPPYLLGILCSQNKTLIYKSLKNKELLLLAVVLSIAALQASLGRYDNYQKHAFEYDGIDLILLQKSILCVFFMLFLHRFENTQNKLLSILASTSFAIYFLHGYVLQLFTVLKAKFQIPIPHPWATYFLVWTALIFGSMFLALLLKKIMPKYARYITGY
ncbi:acyltransferase family protein [Zobellia uliginosa]|uniref:acyltransferase family protein n=1 Tax=Zobellia uliginosa TaxID=143224 RepID=UPI0026E258CE|nr:acyltransferase [Zobellia uliginosa]MDO6515928.1 acyltransferase [Zobellia uliginosa]